MGTWYTWYGSACSAAGRFTSLHFHHEQLTRWGAAGGMAMGTEEMGHHLHHTTSPPSCGSVKGDDVCSGVARGFGEGFRGGRSCRGDFVPRPPELTTARVSLHAGGEHAIVETHPELHCFLLARSTAESLW